MNESTTTLREENQAKGGKEFNPGWIVTFAGTGINLALGVLYTWSVFSKKIVEEWNWSETEANWPFSTCIFVFAFAMILAGRLQDKVGPRFIASIGGLLTGLGMILACLVPNSVPVMVIGFGILTGAGLGFGYASATPPAVKWFPKKKTGLIAGLVVSGFGLASVYISPLAKWILSTWGIQGSFLFFGIFFLVVVVGLAQLLKNPPKGYCAERASGIDPATIKVQDDFAPTEMLKTSTFWLMWIMYFCGAGAGLMIIGKLSKIVSLQGALKTGFLFVALLAVGNAGGRIIAGFVSDKIGRNMMLRIVFIFQAFLMFAMHAIASASLLVAASISIGFCYGACLSIFPSLTKDHFGAKNFGINYGLVFSAWGVGGLVLPTLSSRLYDNSVQASAAGDGNFYLAYNIIGGAMIFATLLSFIAKHPKHH